jgi:hypothetical protein
MADIVERLRDAQNHEIMFRMSVGDFTALVRQAADEIGRLRAALKQVINHDRR